MSLNIYIENQRLSLYKDENIIIKSSVQNVKDISKIFTDVSLSFSVPADKNNNGVFKHFYDSDITGGFDYRTRKNAFIDIDGDPFKQGYGKIKLNSVTMKNNKPESYNIDFFGLLVKLTDLFGDDELNDLDLSAYNHNFNSTNVSLGLSGSGLHSGNVIYPLISSSRNWLWDSDDADDIEYESSTLPSTTNGINWGELKPAIKLARIIDAIESKYGITFSTDFFGTADFEKQYIWCSKEKGNLLAFGEPLLLDFDTGATVLTSFDLYCYSDGNSIEGIHYEQYKITVTPQSGFEDVNYTIIIDDGVSPLEFDKQGIGTALYSIECVDYLNPKSATIQFKIQSEKTFSFSASLSYYHEEYIDVTGYPYALSAGTVAVGTGTGAISTTGYVYITNIIVEGVLQYGQMPKMKISNFLSSLIKLNNLTVAPISESYFTIKKLDDWYSSGNIYDITKYINKKEQPISTPKLYKRISFNYKESETILAEQYREFNGVGYGDLEAEFTTDDGTLEISVDFENMIFERLSSQQTGELSDIHVGKAIDKDLEEVKTNPIIFYNKGITTPTTGIAFISDTGVRSEITTYNNIGQENGLTDALTTNSLNFGSEISTWTLSVQSDSSYSNNWQDYITDLYSENRRIYKEEAILPGWLIAKLELNDKLIIEGKRYLINEMEMNLTTNEVEFELLNDIY